MKLTARLSFGVVLAFAAPAVRTACGEGTTDDPSRLRFHEGDTVRVEVLADEEACVQVPELAGALHEIRLESDAVRR